MNAIADTDAEPPPFFRVAGREIVVADVAMARLYRLVDRLAPSDLPIILSGETGSGKEVLAAAIHERSGRRHRPFVALNCAAIPENLVESELFGYERGSFSGALAAKVGLLELAGGGTVLLDEIGELPLSVQTKLLRVVETKRLIRIGDVKEREVDIRLVAATHRDLRSEVEAGRFRRDLYFRLSGATLEVPPLRDRPAEIPLLAQVFLDEACARLRRPRPRLAEAALRALVGHAWPGNVRELKNAMEYLAVTHETSPIERDVLGIHLEPTAPPPPVSSPRTTFQPLREEIRELEARRIAEALAAAKGNHRRAAALLGLPLRTFFAKVKRHAPKP